jgi:HK97 family phage prohead protease
VELKLLPATEAELKALGDDIPEGYIAGWASTSDLDSYRDVVIPGAFDASIAARGLSGPKGIKLLLNHDWSKVAGAIKVLETRNGRLWIEAQLNLAISYSKDAHEAIKSAGGLSFSVGFFLQEYNIRQDAHGRDYFELVKGDLFEVSVVPFPANEEATMEFYKSAEIVLHEMGVDTVGEEEIPATLAEFEKMLVSTGLAKSRNDARLITLEVKQCAHLFGVKQKEQSVPEPKPELQNEPEQHGEPEAPVAEKSLQSLSSLASKLKQAFSPSINEG